MSDLIKELRESAKYWRTSAPVQSRLFDRAADRIEELAGKVQIYTLRVDRAERSTMSTDEFLWPDAAIRSE